MNKILPTAKFLASKILNNLGWQVKIGEILRLLKNFLNEGVRSQNQSGVSDKA